MFKNTVWMVLDRCVALVSGLTTSLLLAKYLGVEDFGTFTFVFSTMFLFLALGNLGMDSLITKWLINKVRAEENILGSALYLKLAFNVSAFFLFLASVYIFLDPTAAERDTVIACSLVFLAAPITSVVKPWMISKEYFKPIFLTRLISTFFSIMWKVYIIIIQGDVFYFSLAHISMFVIEAVALLYIFTKNDGSKIISWRTSREDGFFFLGQTAQVYAASVIAITYFNIDIFILKGVWNSTVVGEYGLVPQMLAASQILTFAIASVTFPKLVHAYSDARDQFVSLSRKVYLVVLLTGVATAAVFTVVIIPLIPLILGEEFENSTFLLTVATLAIPFLCLRNINSRMVVTLGRYRLFLLLELCGLLLNVALNFALIPQYGGLGAAIATIAALSFSSCFGFVVFSDGRASLRTVFFR